MHQRWIFLAAAFMPLAHCGPAPVPSTLTAVTTPGELDVSTVGHATGLKMPSLAQRRAFLQKTPAVGAVALNALGQSRLTADHALPVAVDNSTLHGCPAIANQGHDSSCTAFSTTYYQLTCEFAQGSDPFSPKWTYNLANDGQDYGAWFDTAYDVLERHGATTMARFPYKPGDYRAWDLNPDDWRDAITYRTEHVQQVGNVSSPSGLSTIKSLLSNGHNVVIGTYSYSWQIGKLSQDPEAAAGAHHAGEAVIESVTGTAGSHAVTIVGYDDDVWTDINGNGSVDPGERGAFKIANSWGSAWGNHGYVWVAYDALLKASAVAGATPSATRLQAIQDDLAYYLPVKPGYQPTLLASFTTTTAHRSNLGIRAGSSDRAARSPANYTTLPAFANSGGSYAFDGTANAVEATFVIDLSDVVTDQAAMRSYLDIKLSDATQAGSSTLTDFHLLDPRTGDETPYNGPLPIEGATTVAIDP